MATSYSSDSEEDVRGQSQSVQRGKQGRAIADGGNGPLVAGAIAGAIGVALVAVGSAILIKRKKKSEKKATPSKDRRRVREGGPRKVPPRRPRSVASSTDVGFSRMSQSSPSAEKVIRTPESGQRTTSNGAEVSVSKPATGASSGPVLPPRKKKAPVEQKSEPKAVSSNEVNGSGEVSDEAARLKEEGKAAVSEIEHAAKEGDAAGTIKGAEHVSDVVDDQLNLMRTQAIDSVVEIMDAVVTAQEAEEDAEAVLKEHEAQIVAEEVKEATDDGHVQEVEEPEVEIANDDDAAVEVKEEEVKKEEVKEEESKEEQELQEGGHELAQVTFTLEEFKDKSIGGTVKGDDRSSVLVADEPEEQYEQLQDIPHPELSFEEAPGADDEMSPLEDKIRNMSVHAHKLIKENNKLKQGLKEQQAALDLALGPEGNGKVRPTLVAACAFSLADMLIAERRINETKVSLATAFAAIARAESKGGQIRALMNYAYVLRNEGKARSTRDTYKLAMQLARQEFGPSSPNVEQVKYEYTAYLAKTGRTDECATLLIDSAEDLMKEAIRLDKEGEEKPEEKLKETSKDQNEDEGGQNLPGLTPTEPETGAETAALSPGQLARHFAMRNLMNAAGVFDSRGEHEKAQAALAQALELAIEVHGENSVQHMNALYAIGVHCKNRDAIDQAIQAHEAVLNIMDNTISVYEPDLLQNRIAILRDTALLYDKKGHPEIAVDYAEGALVNAQTLAKVMASGGASLATRASMLEPFYLLMADIKTKLGDTEGAAEAKREALRDKLNLGLASRGGRSGAPGARTAPPKKRATGTATRAGGRRV